MQTCDFGVNNFNNTFNMIQINALDTRWRNLSETLVPSQLWKSEAFQCWLEPAKQQDEQPLFSTEISTLARFSPKTIFGRNLQR